MLLLVRTVLVNTVPSATLASTVASTVIVTTTPTGRSPMLQFGIAQTTGALSERTPVRLVSVTLTGAMSTSCTSRAVDGPALVTPRCS